MICKPCRKGTPYGHANCPERVRQTRLSSPTGGSYHLPLAVPTDAIGGQLCDCQHRPCQPQPSP